MQEQQWREDPLAHSITRYASRSLARSLSDSVFSSLIPIRSELGAKNLLHLQVTDDTQ